MIPVVVTLRSGAVREVAGKPGWSVMETLRSAGVDDILAICGGSCACATCHVYVDEAFWDALPAQTEEEAALLDFSDHRADRSRLSCQITLSEALAGLRVTVAPEG